MPMMQNYASVSPSINSSPYQLLSPQPNFFFMNTTGVNQPRDLSDPYMQIPINTPPSQFVTPHISQKPK